MGQKVNPIGFRTGIMTGWKSRWYASKQEFANLLLEDLKIREFIKKHPTKSQYRSAGIDRIEIERTRDEVKVIMHVARPGLIIGRKSNCCRMSCRI
jgi:small subunit ribosomal protein S3